MKLEQVTLDRDLRKPELTNEMTRAFRASEGYDLEVIDGLLKVTHTKTGASRVTSQTWIVDALPAKASGAAASEEAPAAKRK